jgi:hypothetical protein
VTAASSAHTRKDRAASTGARRTKCWARRSANELNWLSDGRGRVPRSSEEEDVKPDLSTLACIGAEENCRTLEGSSSEDVKPDVKPGISTLASIGSGSNKEESRRLEGLSSEDAKPDIKPDVSDSDQESSRGDVGYSPAMRLGKNEGVPCLGPRHRFVPNDVITYPQEPYSSSASTPDPQFQSPSILDRAIWEEWREITTHEFFARTCVPITECF